MPKAKKLQFLLPSICVYTDNAIWRWVFDNKVPNDDFVGFDWVEDDVDAADVEQLFGETFFVDFSI